MIPDPSLPVDWDSVDSTMVEIKGKLVPYFIESISARADKFFIKFEDVDVPEDADRLIGCSLFLLKETRTELDEGDFYNDEVIGFDVMDEILGTIGKVKDIEQAGPNRFFLIDYNNKEVMIPAHGPLVVEINRDLKVIRVMLPDGLLEL